MMHSMTRTLRFGGPMRYAGARWMSALHPTAMESRISLKEYEKRIARGPGKDAGFEIVPVEKWKGVNPAELFTDTKDAEVRAELNKLRDIEAEVMEGISSKKAPDIDWEYWEKEIPCPESVEAIKKHYEDIEIPDFDAILKEKEEAIRNTLDPLIKEVTEFGKQLDDNIKMYEKRLQEVTSLKSNLEDLTVEEWLDKNPHCRKEIEEDLTNNKWFASEPEPAAA